MVIHVVQRGDTLYNIARRYGVSMQRLMSDNGLTASQTLVVGQALIILLPEIVYTVRRGDTLGSIAAAYGVTEIELLQNNPDLIQNPVLQPGQMLAIKFQGEKIREITTTGFAYPHIMRPVLRRALPYLTYLAIFSYGFREDGSLIGVDDNELISLAYTYRTAPVMVFSSITEDGNFSSERVSLLLNDIALQNRVLDNVIAVMLEKGYVGLDMDFEYIPAADAGAYLGFLGNASARLHEHGFWMSVDVAPKTSPDQPGLLYEAHNYAAIGGIADTVMLMTYEWGYTYGPPMAVAPLNEVRRVVQYAVTEIPPQKLLLGIPNYGYDWQLPFERGSRAQNIGNQYAVQLAARRGAEIRFDEKAQSPYFEYYLGGVKHIVWFEDVRSIAAKLALTDEYGLLGAGYWTVMRPFAQNWAYLAAKYNIRKVV